MTFVRALHYASLLSLAGTLLFAAFVAEPALRRHVDGGYSAFRRQLARVIWGSLALGVLTGLLWLALEASSMSAKTLAQVFAQGIIPIVLARTRFGHDWVLRGILAIPLTLCLFGGVRPATAMARVCLWMAMALGAAELAMIAGAGHAAAGTGWTGGLHLIGDGAHLLAAGAWLGGLLPLALLFAGARRGHASGLALATHQATLRFSFVGILAVATLLATGVLNAVFLVGSISALLGTDYGHLLMLKIALFLTMVTFAAINREWLMPQLAGVPDGSSIGVKWDILRQLQRNALIEAGLGTIVLLIVGALGTTPPALHMQPQWPLPLRLTLDTLKAQPTVRTEAIAMGVVAVGGVALLAFGLLRPRQRMFQLLAGLFIFLAVGWWPLQFMVVTAYPTSFYRSLVPLTASSIVRGRAVYADNCAACHGIDGHGDGPLAKSTPVKPADLTAAHSFEQSDGDLFWWISQGIASGGMPGFATALDAQQRWNVINFIYARAAAAQPRALQSRVTAGPAPRAPDFTFQQRGTDQTLRQLVEQRPVLLMFYELPRSQQRLHQLAAAESILGAAGLQLLALPLEAEDTGSATPLPDFAATADADAVAAYHLFMGKNTAAPCEFLIDRAGFLRAHWEAGTLPGLPDEAALLAQLNLLAQLPLPQQVSVHAH